MTHIMRIWWHWHFAMLSWRQDHILTENIWFVWSKTSYSGDERCYRCGTTNDDDEQWRKGAGWFGSVQPFIRCTYLWQWLDARCIRISSTHPCWSVTNTKCTWPAYLLSFASLFSTCEQQIFKSLCRCKSYFSEPLNASPSYFFPLKTCRRARFPSQCTRGESDQDQKEGNWRVEVPTRVWRIYLNIRINWSQIYIRTFVPINFSFTNIFGHSFVSNLFVRIYSDIRWWVC